ncbi:MAG TPA: Trk system potassium transporter TrkA, partial [Terriglobales bacterium]|nr:Trk system potassium transporter TrkA [Terriglobales bacterium]
RGNGVSYKDQTEAGVSDADLLIAVTSGDELNIISCLIAKKLGAKHTIARIRDPEYSEQLAFLRDDLGLSMAINPERAAAREIVRVINFPSANSVRGLVKGRVELVECRIEPDSMLCGTKLFKVRDKFKLNILLCLLERKCEIFIPTADDVFEAGDKVYVTGTPSDILAFMKAAGHEQHKVHTVLIIGGGKIGYYLARQLLTSGLNVKIIEKKKERCQELCELLPQALVINGDGTERSLLEEELAESDVLVALTDIDEENLIVSMYASKCGVKKVIAKINRTEYLPLAEDIGIDSIISPKQITAYQIIQYVRAMQNTIGSQVEALVRVANERAEVLEFVVAENARHQNEPLSTIPLKKNLVIAAIVRMDKLIVPSGNTHFEKGDSIIIVTMNHNFTDMNDIFEDGAQR